MNLMSAWLPTSFLFKEELCAGKDAALDRSLRVPCGSENVLQHINKLNQNKAHKFC